MLGRKGRYFSYTQLEQLLITTCRQKNCTAMEITLDQITVAMIEPSVPQQKIITRYLNAQGVKSITYYVLLVLNKCYYFYLFRIMYY